MTQFFFRNTIVLVPGEYLTTDGPRLVLHSESGTEVIIRPLDEAQPFRDATHLLMLGGPYGTEDEAIRAGQSWRRQLLMACSDRSIGIDIGDEAEHRPLRIPLGQREFSPDDAVILKQRHGLQVYPSSGRGRALWFHCVHCGFRGRPLI